MTLNFDLDLLKVNDDISKKNSWKPDLYLEKSVTTSITSERTNKQTNWPITIPPSECNKDLLVSAVWPGTLHTCECRLYSLGVMIQQSTASKQETITQGWSLSVWVFVGYVVFYTTAFERFTRFWSHSFVCFQAYAKELSQLRRQYILPENICMKVNQMSKVYMIGLFARKIFSRFWGATVPRPRTPSPHLCFQVRIIERLGLVVTSVTNKPTNKLTSSQYLPVDCVRIMWNIFHFLLRNAL